MKEVVPEKATLILRDEERQKLLQIGSISLWLDDYSDIFSDFDPRPYSEKVLSDDFLSEAKKAARDTVSGKIQLSLLVPKDKRNYGHEMIIRKRLHSKFKEQYHYLEKEKNRIIKNGSLFIISGIFMMLFVAYMVFMDYGDNMFLVIITVIFEPGGWFLFWEGLNLMIFDTKKFYPDLEFYKKMASCEVIFSSY